MAVLEGRVLATRMGRVEVTRVDALLLLSKSIAELKGKPPIVNSRPSSSLRSGHMLLSQYWQVHRRTRAAGTIIKHCFNFHKARIHVGCMSTIINKNIRT